MADKEKKADNTDHIRKETDDRAEGATRREKDVVTEASEDSFPASDPPSYMAGSAISGSPPSRKTADGDEDKTGDKKD